MRNDPDQETNAIPKELSAAVPAAAGLAETAAKSGNMLPPMPSLRTCLGISLLLVAGCADSQPESDHDAPPRDAGGERGKDARDSSADSGTPPVVATDPA